MAKEEAERTFEGFESANTTPVPDILFDELLSVLSGSELKVMLYIIRRTLGFKKTSDSISLNQFEKGITTKEGKVLDKGCGIKDRHTLLRVLKSLESKWNCIESDKIVNEKGECEPTRYRIKFKTNGVEAKITLPVQLGSVKNTTTLEGKNTLPTGGKSTLPVVGKIPPTRNSIQETVIQEDYVSANAERTHASAGQDYNAKAATFTAFMDDLEQGKYDASDLSTKSHIATADTQTALLQAEPKKEGTPTEEVSPPNVEKPSRSRKPGKPKEPAVSPERIEAVFDCLDKMARQVTGDASFKYDRSTKTSREKVAELLKDRIVTQEALEAVYLELWNTPADPKTGFEWKNNMSVKAICNNFERVWLSIKGKIQTKQAQTQNGQKVSAAVKAGYTDYTNSPPIESRPLRMPNDRKRA